MAPGGKWARAFAERKTVLELGGNVFVHDYGDDVIGWLEIQGDTVVPRTTRR